MTRSGVADHQMLLISGALHCQSFCWWFCWRAWERLREASLKFDTMHYATTCRKADLTSNVCNDPLRQGPHVLGQGPQIASVHELHHNVQVVVVVKGVLRGDHICMMPPHDMSQLLTTQTKQCQDSVRICAATALCATISNHPHYLLMEGACVSWEEVQCCWSGQLITAHCPRGDFPSRRRQASYAVIRRVPSTINDVRRCAGTRRCLRTAQPSLGPLFLRPAPEHPCT